MILAVDIGNSNITFGGFVSDTPKFVARIKTDTQKTSDEYAVKLTEILLLYGIDKKNISGTIISSVVPPLSPVIKNALRFITEKTPLFVGPGIKTGLNIHCDDPSSVGADLIAASVAAYNIYGAPALIIDMGTATKMMLIDKKGAFSGVSIIPGILMGLKALSSGTAQLPQVSLEIPPSIIGRNTADCMRSGVIFGNASMIDGMIDRIFEESGYSLPVYATGGLASLIIDHCKHDIILDENMVLKGLYILYNKNSR